MQRTADAADVDAVGHTPVVPDRVGVRSAVTGAAALVGRDDRAARRGQPVLLLALLPAIFLPPLFNGQYKPILAGRYLMPLVPVLFVGIGLALAAQARVLYTRPGGLDRGGLLALLFVWAANRVVNEYFIQTIFFDREMIFVGVVGGALMGVFGSIVSVGRHLRRI